MPKNYLTKKDLPVNLAIGFCVAFFFIFGLFHLAKFETVDEHFWKYERITQYWLEGVFQHNPQKTYINDKPGVATAIISGFGLPFIQNPTEHRIRDQKITDNDNDTVYDSAQTEKLNFALRLPLLLFNAIFLIYFFWIIKKLGRSNLLAILSTFFIASSPILIGISQIINPDTLLWTFGSSALLSYFVFLRQPEKKYLIATIILTGLALLAKYTASLLFVLYPLSFFAYVIFDKNFSDEYRVLRKKVLDFISSYASILIGSAIIFALGMPAAIVKLKYLYRGTIGSPAFHPVMLPIFFIIALMLVDAILFKSFLFKKTIATARKFQVYFFRTAALLMLTLFLFLLFNSWFGQSFIPLNDIHEEAYFEKALIFPMFAQDVLPVKIFKEIATELYPLPFSISPIILFFILFLWSIIIFGKKIQFQSEVFIATLLPLIIAIGSLISGVLLNPRYLILVYPIMFFLAAIGAIEFINYLDHFKKISRQKIIIASLSLVIMSAMIGLWSIKPFYFNYMNFLLPKDQVITDSWGYGAYEAAQYLNSLPNAADIIVWADRNTICQFIQGKCIQDYKINITETIPDYFILTRRGSIRHQFIWRYSDLAKKSSTDYYDMKKSPSVWRLDIDGREENFIRIVKSEEK